MSEKKVTSYSTNEEFNFNKQWNNNYWNVSLVVNWVSCKVEEVLWLGNFIDHENLKKKHKELEEKYEELNEKHEEEKKISYFDKLTWVANRRKFDEHLEEEIERVKRTFDKFVLVVCDIDKFKVLNDTFGHSFWDIVLKKVAKIISKEIRALDFIARYWWEEFVLILPHTDISWWVKMAEKIRHIVSEFSTFEEESRKNIKTTLSFWVSEYKESDTPESLFIKSDKALYRAKESWRNKVCAYENKNQNS